MSKRLSIRVTPRAASEIRAASAWWREFEREDFVTEAIKKAFARLSRFPYMGEPARSAAFTGVRRLSLRRLRHYLYYRVDESASYVEVLAFWHMSRGGGPVLSE